MYVQGVENVFELNFNGRDGEREGDLWRRVPAGRAGIFAAQFRISPTPTCCSRSSAWRKRPARNISTPAGRRRRWRQQSRPHLLALPAYDQCIKASHVFNLLDARGVISVTERQSYILRVRELAKACGEAWLATEGGGEAAYERANARDRRPRADHDRCRSRQDLLVVRLRPVEAQPFCDGSHKARASRRSSSSRRRPRRSGSAPASARPRSRCATAATTSVVIRKTRGAATRRMRLTSSKHSTPIAGNPALLNFQHVWRRRAGSAIPPGGARRTVPQAHGAASASLRPAGNAR